jgi:hypothetical protein
VSIRPGVCRAGSIRTSSERDLDRSSAASLAACSDAISWRRRWAGARDVVVHRVHSAIGLRDVTQVVADVIRRVDGDRPCHCVCSQRGPFSSTGRRGQRPADAVAVPRSRAGVVSHHHDQRSSWTF